MMTSPSISGASPGERAKVIYLQPHDYWHVVPQAPNGDWVEHCTSLVEHRDGMLELLHWTQQQRSLARHRGAPEPDEEALPAAA